MRAINTAIVFFLAFGVAGYALVVYGMLPLGSLVHPDMQANYLLHNFGIYTHVFAASVALLLGPFQFITRLRQARPQLHRWLGRIYLSMGVLVGGLAGLYMAQYAYGGVVAQTGFALLALCWLYTGVRAFVAIRNGAVAEHRQWMIRNFALTFAAVTLRIYLPAALASGIAFEQAYPVIAWLCWLPNLLVAEWVFNRKRSPV